MSNSSLLLAAAVAAVLAILTVFVQAQPGMTIGCANCIQQKLLMQVPQCSQLNLTNVTDTITPEYRECICHSSYDFNWTLGCLDFGTCQTTEIKLFEQQNAGLITALNLSCVKPTPTPTSAASNLLGHGRLLGIEATAASAIVMTVLAGGIGAFLAIVGFQ